MTSPRDYLLIAVFIFAVITFADSKSKPKPVDSYFTVCRRGDPEQMNECVKKTVTELQTTIKNGIPALGVVPLEPLVIPRMSVNEESGSFSYSTTLINFTLHGLMSDYIVKSAKVQLDDENFVLNYHTVSPRVISTAEYEMNGKILVIPLQGRGNCEFNFTDFSMDLKTRGKIVSRSGKQFVQVTDVHPDLSYNYKESRFWLFNLFNGDERLGNATNHALNENGEEAFIALRHLFEEGFSQILKDQFSKVFDVYPVDELFPK